MVAPGETRHFVLTLWTADPDLASRADQAGVDRVGLDLEALGKRGRQPEKFSTWITDHRIDHLPAVGAVLTRAKLFVRTNSLHSGLSSEVQQFLDLGVKVLMFPNFQDASELKTFLGIVNGRAEVIPLVERLAATRQIQRIVALPEINEIHVGMNDLALDLGLKNRMAVLISKVIEEIASAVADSGKRLGVGGLARAGDSSLPIPSDLVYAQYPRLRATAALISRSFSPQTLPGPMFSHEIARLRERMRSWFACSPEEIHASYLKLQAYLSKQN